MNHRAFVLALSAGLLAPLLPPDAVGQAVPPSSPGSVAGIRRTDLVRFRTEVLGADRSFSVAARAEAERRLIRLEQSIADVTPVYFELELARIVALADNGHTVAFPAPRSRHFNRVGLRVAPFGENFFVLRATDSLADLLGARLDGIDGRPIAEVRAVARTLQGGTDGWRDRNAGFFLESPEQMHALGMARSEHSAAYRFVLPDGRTVTRTLHGLPAPARGQGGLGTNPWQLEGATPSARRWFYPEPVPGEGPEWRALLAPAAVAWAFQEEPEPFRLRFAPELNAVVVQLRRNRGTNLNPLEPFFAAVETEIRQRHPRHLVVDLRMNGGGDLNTTRDFMRRLPTLVDGRIFVLTSPFTFSAAISSTGYLKQAAPARVTIVGETAGDRLEFWAEGRPRELPGTGGVYAIATERHDYLNGCRGYSDCHAPVVQNPIAISTLQPEIVAPWTFETYRAGRDPGLEAVAAALRVQP